MDALAVVKARKLDLASAMGALFAAAATLIALTPEGEWRDIIDAFAEAMPAAVGKLAAEMQEAGIVASLATRQ